MVHTGEIKRRKIEDGHHIAGGIALEVLIPGAGQILIKTVITLAEKCGRGDLGVDGLRKSLRKTLAKDVGAQVFSRNYATQVGTNHIGSSAVHVLAGFVGGVLDAAIHHPEVVNLHIALIARNGAEAAMLCPATRGPQLGAHGRVHAAINGPVECITENKSLA